MILELDNGPNVTPAVIRLATDFYFQTSDKKWVIKKKNGKVDSSRFFDWNTDADACKLQVTGKLELSIEPPETEGKRA